MNNEHPNTLPQQGGVRRGLSLFLSEWNNSSDKVQVHTSGSTGKPKLLWVEKQKMLNSAKITCDFLGLRQGDTALLCMPLDYIAGKMMVVRSLERGLKLVSVSPSSHPLSDKSLSEAGFFGSITFAAMVPMQVISTLKVPKERERLMQIKHLIIGGGAIDDRLQEALKDFPNAVWSTYGMTETLSHIALRKLNGADAGEWYQAFDSVELSQTSEGCLVIKAPLVCKETLVTNDRVEIRRQANGKPLFKILGRMDNVINSGGIKIQIEEVEAKLKSCISDNFAITKQSDNVLGERVVLLTESADPERIQAVCHEILPKYWQPKQVYHIDKLPLTGTGKPARKEIERVAKALLFASYDV